MIFEIFCIQSNYFSYNLYNSENTYIHMIICSIYIIEKYIDHKICMMYHTKTSLTRHTHSKHFLISICNKSSAKCFKFLVHSQNFKYTCFFVPKQNDIFVTIKKKNNTS